MAKQTPRSSGRKRSNPYRSPKSKSARRKLAYSGPTRTMVPMTYHRPQLKWNVGKLTGTQSITQSTYFKSLSDISGGSASLFNLEHGSANNQRVGNSVTAREIQVKYCLPPFFDDVAGALVPDKGNTEQNLWIVRDTEPQATAPAGASEWQTALFSDNYTSISSRWSQNFRNPDYTNRFQIVKALNINAADAFAGRGESLNGYMTFQMNTELKFPIGTGVRAPTNVRYYLLYHVSDINTAVVTTNISPEITVKTTYVDN